MGAPFMRFYRMGGHRAKLDRPSPTPPRELHRDLLLFAPAKTKRKRRRVWSTHSPPHCLEEQLSQFFAAVVITLAVAVVDVTVSTIGVAVGIDAVIAALAESVPVRVMS